MSPFRRTSLAIVALLAGASTFVSPTCGATIEPLDSDVCHLLLRGDIEDGDLERFKEAVERVAAGISARTNALAAIETEELHRVRDTIAAGKAAPGDMSERIAARKKPIEQQASRVFKFQHLEHATPRFVFDNEVVTVCLNSLGGSFAEARKIIAYMLSGDGVAMVIRAGDECDSACALIFMFGNVKAALPGRTIVERRFMDRRLDVRGKLGLHAPYQTAEAAASVAVLRKAYEEGVKAVANLLDLDEIGFLARPLIVAFLKTGAGEFQYLDTIAKAGSWGVELMGFRDPAALTSAELERACENDLQWTAERRKSNPLPIEPPKGPLDSPLPWFLSSESREIAIDNMRHAVVRRTLYSQYYATGSTCCIAKLQGYEKGKLALRIEHELGFKDNSMCLKATPMPEFTVPDERPVVGSEGFVLNRPLWFVYPAETKLEDIAARD